jgi:hypothetical protein
MGESISPKERFIPLMKELLSESIKLDRLCRLNYDGGLSQLAEEVSERKRLLWNEFIGLVIQIKEPIISLINPDTDR